MEDVLVAKLRYKMQIPVAKCDVRGCYRIAAYGFRETVDTEKMKTAGFLVGEVVNWCARHDPNERTMRASKAGEFVSF